MTAEYRCSILDLRFSNGGARNWGAGLGTASGTGSGRGSGGVTTSGDLGFSSTTGCGSGDTLRAFMVSTTSITVGLFPVLGIRDLGAAGPLCSEGNLGAEGDAA